MPKFDFDEAVKENENEPLQIVLNGREYVLPPQLPAKVVLTQIALMDETGGLANNDIPTWLGALVGEENLKQMLDDGATWEQLEAVTMKLLKFYKIIPEEEIETGLEDAPK
tara:strand:+ start:5315 stop:5647 length:333 start_codon:yes stop_codon:yes gene_type:complete